jgi:hypothetical protein
MDLRFRTWNVRSLHNAGLLKRAASELARYNLALVAVKQVTTDDHTFLFGNGNANHLGLGIFVHKGIM